MTHSVIISLKLRIYPFTPPPFYLSLGGYHLVHDYSNKSYHIFFFIAISYSKYGKGLQAFSSHFINTSSSLSYSMLFSMKIIPKSLIPLRLPIFRQQVRHYEVQQLRLSPTHRSGYSARYRHDLQLYGK